MRRTSRTSIYAAAAAFAPLFLLTLACPSGSDAAEFRRVSLDIQGRVKTVLPADLNGDGLKDLAVSFVSGVEPRETRYLTVFWQNKSGNFVASSTALEVPSTAALIDVGRLVDGFDALLLMSFDGIDRVTMEGEEVSGLERVLVADSLVFHGELGDLTAHNFALDLFHDGITRFVVPQWGRFAIAEPGEDSRYQITQTIDIPQQAYYSPGPARYGLRYDDFSLQITIRVPQHSAADMNGDGKPELLVHVDENIFVYGWADGLLESWPSHVRHFAVRTDEEKLSAGTSVEMTVKDINGDQIPDVILNKISGGISAMKSHTEIYTGRSDMSFAKSPARVYDEEGFSAGLQFVDLDGDGPAELIVPSADMGLWQLSQIAMSGKIPLEFRIFAGSSAGPDQKTEQGFEATLLIDFASGAQLKSPVPTFKGDFNGDGRPDLLVSRGEELFEAVPSKNGIVDIDEPIAGVEVPISRFITVFNSGADNLDDFLLYYPFDKDKNGRIEVLLLQPSN